MSSQRVTPTDMRTPLKRVRALGSARSGVGQWWWERLTAAALIPLSLWFVWLVLRLPHLDFASAHLVVATPWNTLLLILFTATGFWHGQLGLQVIIEDYVHGEGAKMLLLLANTLYVAAAAAVAIFAVLKLSFGS